MCFSLKIFGGWKSIGLRFLFLLAISWKVCEAGNEDPIQMSTLVSDTVHNLIEKISEETFDNVGDATIPLQNRQGYGHGGNGHGAITLDPVSIISLLALGAFLINNILQLLRANMNTTNGRSMTTSDMFPLFSPTSSASSMNFSSDQPSFMNFFENVGSLYYLQPKKRNICMKRVVCNYINGKESREKNPTHLRNKIFDFMISTVTKLVAPEITETDKQEKCMRAQKYCSDSLLKDARVSVEYKIYSQVSGWITKLAFNGLASG